MKIGVFGGSFDPVHFGHISPVTECRVYFNLDCVFYLPAKLPPHKTGKELSSSFHRMAMLALALKDVPGARIETIELLSNEGRYTVDTLAALKQKVDAEFYLIIGSDNLSILPTWRDVPRLLSLATMVVLNRPGMTFSDALDRLPRPLRARCEGDHPRITTFPHDAIDISASSIRERLSAGESIAGLTPRSVERYIRRNQLYARK